MSERNLGFSKPQAFGSFLVLIPLEQSSVLIKNKAAIERRASSIIFHRSFFYSEAVSEFNSGKWKEELCLITSGHSVVLHLLFE